MDTDTTTEAGGSDANGQALGAFLELLAHDIDAHPVKLMAVDAGMRNRIQSLVGATSVDLTARLPDDNE
ncbi:MAG: type II toxin-antitoxin system PrlF family antitoxin [Porticoccaceae bacterium]